jgi:hypothetical protein
MRKSKLLTAALLLCAAVATAQSEIAPYMPGVTQEGAVYYLPKTALRFTVQVEKTTYSPGQFCMYAARYLRLNDVQQEASVAYRVTNVTVTTLGVADNKRAYAVKFNPKSVAANVSLAEDGRLLAINTTNKDVDTTPSKFVASPKPKREDPRKYLSADILAAGSTAKMAELTAQDIYEIRDSKNQLNRGEADFMPKDGQQLRIMLDNLDKQEREMTLLFTGTVEKDTTEHTFVVCPESEISKQVLFRLSQKLGFVDKDDLSGAPFYLTVEDLHSIPTTPADAVAPKKKKETESGIYVNVPGKAKASVTNGGKTVASVEFNAGQFGKVELLSGELFNKRSTTRLTLSPITGAVDRLDAEMPK